jgi:glycosyltransferase involved in cell wall biosynthesis
MNRLRVGINLLWLQPGRAGGAERYATGLVRSLADEAADDLELTIFCSSSFGPAYEDLSERLSTVVAPIHGRSRVARIAVESTWLARETSRRDVQLVHHLNDVIPWVRSRPSALTIHDLRSMAGGAVLGRGQAAYLRAAVPRSVRAARVVMTPTEFVRREVIDRFSVDPARVAVVSAPVPRPMPRMDLAAATTALEPDGPYFLYPAITNRHKNHRTLLDAFAKVVAGRPDLRLVLTGTPGNADPEVGDAIRRLGLEGRVIRAGRLADPAFDRLLADAVALVYPSTYEGFGLPLTEAMAVGCPVVASATTALPEVVGEAGILVDPDDVDGWTDAMLRVLDDEPLRERLIAAGRERVRPLTPAATARRLVAAYRLALEAT